MEWKMEWKNKVGEDVVEIDFEVFFYRVMMWMSCLKYM
jgi:hypothetical protein